MVQKAEDLSIGTRDVSVAMVTHSQGEADAEPTVWPAAPKATAILQRYAATVNTLDHEELLERRIAKLKTQVKRQKAANDEAEANLVLHDVIRGHRDVGDVPLDLLAVFKKVVEKRIQEAAGSIYFRSL